MSTVNNLELVPGCLRQCAHAVCKELPGADAFCLGKRPFPSPLGGWLWLSEKRDRSPYFCRSASVRTRPVRRRAVGLEWHGGESVVIFKGTVPHFWHTGEWIHCTTNIRYVRATSLIILLRAIHSQVESLMKDACKDISTACQVSNNTEFQRGWCSGMPGRAGLDTAP